MKRHFVLVAAGLAASAAIAASAATPAETIAARQANFKQLGRSMKAIGDELKKPTPDLAVIRPAAQALAQASTRVGGGFPRGTGPETGAKTDALPAIWQRGPEFQTKATDLVAKARELQAAAAGGNIDRIKAAFPATGGTCRSCHETFRKRD